VTKPRAGMPSPHGRHMSVLLMTSLFLISMQISMTCGDDHDFDLGLFVSFPLPTAGSTPENGK